MTVNDDVIEMRQYFAAQCELELTKQSYLDGFHDDSDLFQNALLMRRKRRMASEPMKRVWDRAMVEAGFMSTADYVSLWGAG